MAKTRLVAIGDKINMLTVIKQVDDKIEKSGKHRACFLCKCDCGKMCVCEVKALTNKGKEKLSCGCVKRYNLRKINSEATSRQRLYHIWIGIKTRCYNPKHQSFRYYGAKGIIMCDEWRNSYDSFRSWSLDNGYTDNLTIDRIDVYGNYNPSNCRWVDRTAQSRNRRDNHFIEENGKRKTLAEWGEENGLTGDGILSRLKRGWGERSAVTTPKIENIRYITINGETHNLAEWSEIKGYKPTLISTRIRRGWNEKEAVLTPPFKKGCNRNNQNKKI